MLVPDNKYVIDFVSNSNKTAEILPVIDAFLTGTISLTDETRICQLDNITEIGSKSIVKVLEIFQNLISQPWFERCGKNQLNTVVNQALAAGESEEINSKLLQLLLRFVLFQYESTNAGFLGFLLDRNEKLLELMIRFFNTGTDDQIWAASFVLSHISHTDEDILLVKPPVSQNLRISAVSYFQSTRKNLINSEELLETLRNQPSNLPLLHRSGFF